MTRITCKDVNVSYRSGPVLKSVSFDATKGQLIGVIGPNGAGKSTLIRALAGLQSYSGDIQWDGRDVHRMAATERAKTIAYMPQARTVHWTLPCLDVVLLGRLPHHSRFAGPSEKDRETALAAMSQMDVQGFAARPFDKLSGGEQARVLIARMLAQDSACFLADEPVNGLDPAHQISLMQTFQKFAQAGRLVFVSLHDLTLAGRWCDRLLLIEHGSLKADTSPGELIGTGLIQQVYGIETMDIMLAGQPTIVPAAVRSNASTLVPNQSDSF